MQGCLVRVVRQATVGLLGVCLLAPAFAQPATQTQPGLPGPFDVCKGLTGADAPTKVAACTEAIKDGKLAPNDLALAHLNRGLSESGPGSEQRSTSRLAACSPASQRPTSRYRRRASRSSGSP